MSRNATASDHVLSTQDRPRRGLWVPIGVVVVAAVALAALRCIETWEPLAGVHSRMARYLTPFLSRFIVVGVTSILLVSWLMFLAPLSRVVRIRAAAVLVALLITVLATVRIDGVNGDIVPRLRFRWSPRADEALAPLAAGQETSSTNIDLGVTGPGDYPQFLGPNRQATLHDLHLARDWAVERPRLLWRHSIGAGWSSFAVVGHFGVTQEQRGKEELITCYDIDTGKLEWAQSTLIRFAETAGGIGPRATPTIHEGRVFALGALGDLYCLDGANGKPLWHHQVVTENRGEVPQWGKSCSPLICDKLVIVSAGGQDGKSLVAYDQETGGLAWSAGDDSSSYSSPTLMTLCGVRQIVIMNAKEVTAHDPADGRILWRHPWPDGIDVSPNVAQPIAVGEDRVLLSKGYGVGSAVWQIAHKDDDWSVELVWKGRNLKTKFTNAVVRDGFAFALDEGILSCIDIGNGYRMWKAGKYGHGQVLLVDDLLLVQSESGEVALAEATPGGYDELTRFSAVSGQSWNCPALAGNKLLVRSDEEAACYELPVAR